MSCFFSCQLCLQFCSVNWVPLRDAVSKLDDNEVRHLLEETTLSDALKCHVAEICGALLGIMPRDQVLISLNLFIKLVFISLQSCRSILVESFLNLAF